MNAFQVSGFECRPPSCPSCYQLMRRETHDGVSMWVCRCRPGVSVKQFDDGKAVATYVAATNPPPALEAIRELIRESAARNLAIAIDCSEDDGEDIDVQAFAEALARNLAMAIGEGFDVGRRVISAPAYRPCDQCEHSEHKHALSHPRQCYADKCRCAGYRDREAINASIAHDERMGRHTP